MNEIDKKLEKLELKKELVRRELSYSFRSFKNQINPFYWAGGAGLAILNHFMQPNSTAPAKPEAAADASQPPPEESAPPGEEAQSGLGSMILHEALEYLKYRMERESE